MIESVYQFLAYIGYHHPLHPALTHMPVGLMFGAFLLGLAGLIFRRQTMALAARYCAVIAFIFFFPTVLLGVMDWQHYFAGGWLLPIKMKLVLAALLFVLLSYALIAGRKGEAVSMRLAGIYVLCFLTTVGLGFFGGQLVYTGKAPHAPPALAAGESLFMGNCSGCHPYGGNIAAQNAPLRGSPKLKDLETFLHFIRDPRTRRGTKGAMPAFRPSRISDSQAEQLRLYIAGVMGFEAHPEEAELKIPQFTVKTDAASIESGRQLFEVNCTGCHTADSTATIIGPGLKGILKREKLPVSGRPAIPANIYRQLRKPYKDMPAFAHMLTDDEVFSIIAFLNTR